MYTSATASVAATVKDILKADTANLSALPDDVRTQAAADVQVLLF
jgi:hypothetical protein